MDEETRAAEYNRRYERKAAFVDRLNNQLRGSESARLDLESKTVPLTSEQNEDDGSERVTGVSNQSGVGGGWRSA